MYGGRTGMREREPGRTRRRCLALPFQRSALINSHASLLSSLFTGPAVDPGEDALESGYRRSPYSKGDKPREVRARERRGGALPARRAPFLFCFQPCPVFFFTLAGGPSHIIPSHQQSALSGLARALGAGRGGGGPTPCAIGLVLAALLLGGAALAGVRLSSSPATDALHPFASLPSPARPAAAAIGLAPPSRSAARTRPMAQGVGPPPPRPAPRARARPERADC